MLLWKERFWLQELSAQPEFAQLNSRRVDNHKERFECVPSFIPYAKGLGNVSRKEYDVELQKAYFLEKYQASVDFLHHKRIHFNTGEISSEARFAYKRLRRASFGCEKDLYAQHTTSYFENQIIKASIMHTRRRRHFSTELHNFVFQ